MPHHPVLTITGTITHVFAHRFVVDTERGAVLADVTPKGLALFKLTIGDRVTLEGERKPSELKVARFTRSGVTTDIPHKDKHHHDDADPRVAERAARAAGYATLAAPRRKPKHFEVLGERDGHTSELHIELDGHIRKTKPADRHDPKWELRPRMT